MIKWIIYVFVLCPAVCLSQAKDVYKLDKKLDYGIAGGSAIVALADLILLDRIEPLSDEEILALDINDIISFDQSAVRQNSRSAKDLSDVLEYGVFFLPAPLMLSKDIRGESKEIMVMYLEAFSINVFSTHLVKLLTKRARPFVYNQELNIDGKRSKNARMSFYSGHASHTAALSFLTAKVYADFYPDSKWKPFMWTAALAIPIGTGYLRYKAGSHYPSDVAVGVITGSVLGYLIPQLHKVNMDLPEGLGIETTNDGLTLSYRW